MRRLFVLALLVLLAAVPASARANGVTLWACHGPAGGALPFSYTALASTEAEVSAPGGGCGLAGGTLRLGFKRTDPLADQSAKLRFAMPPGVTVDHLWLSRRVDGPGYWARSSTSALESLTTRTTFDGVFEADAGGQWIELELRCDEAPATRCDAAGTGVDFRFAALAIRDEVKPSFGVSGLPLYAKDTIAVTVDASDSGLGLANVGATLAGAPAAAVKLGQSYCSELSPSDTTVDLPLAEDCPSSSRVVLKIDTTAVADGVQRLDLTATDAAGNSAARGFDLRVLNHPPGVTPTPTPAPPKKPVVTPTPTPAPIANTGVLRIPKSYAVSRTGSFKVDASCPAAAPASCLLNLKLSAKLPGRTKAATIASARKTAKPGASAKITLKLTASARSALVKKRKLSAVLTLAGAAPVTVHLKR